MVEYRANFVMFVFMALAFLASKLVYIFVVFGAGTAIGDLNPDEVLLYVGTFILITGLYVGFFMSNLYELPELVRTGSLDLMLTKPLSFQFLVSCRSYNIAGGLVNIISGVLMVATAWQRLHIPASVGAITGYCALLFSGVVLAYAVFSFPLVLSFWTVRTGAVLQLSNAVWVVNRMPQGIYPSVFVKLLTYALPVLLVTNAPTLHALGRLSWIDLIWSFVAPCVFLALNAGFWRVAIRRYTGAGG